MTENEGKLISINNNKKYKAMGYRTAWNIWRAAHLTGVQPLGYKWNSGGGWCCEKEDTGLMFACLKPWLSSFSMYHKSKTFLTAFRQSEEISIMRWPCCDCESTSSSLSQHVFCWVLVLWDELHICTHTCMQTHTYIHTNSKEKLIRKISIKNWRVFVCLGVFCCFFF